MCVMFVSVCCTWLNGGMVHTSQRIPPVASSCWILLLHTLSIPHAHSMHRVCDWCNIMVVMCMFVCDHKECLFTGCYLDVEISSLADICWGID